MDPLNEYSGSDFYCDVAIPHSGLLTVVHEDEQVLAFHHTRPYWRTHIVVVPKRHIPSFTDGISSEDDLMKHLLGVVQVIAQSIENTHGAARILTNLGEYQDSKHLHVHISSGEPTAR